MNLNPRDLGIRIANNKFFRPTPGMLLVADNGWTGRVISDDPVYVGCRRALVMGNPQSGDGMPYVQGLQDMKVYPDVTDPATVGCIQALIKTAEAKYNNPDLNAKVQMYDLLDLVKLSEVWEKDS